jgi:flagellar protein FlbD
MANDLTDGKDNTILESAVRVLPDFGRNEVTTMIKVTRLNNKEFVVNAELVQFIEETPDTVITLVNHEKIVVKEPVDIVIQRIIEYGRSLRCLPT